MIKVSVMYPNEAGASFDHAYYRDIHMPMVAALMGEACRLKHEAGQPAACKAVLPRLFAYGVKVSTRYVQLSPLTHLLQELQGSLVQTGFTLR